MKPGLHLGVPMADYLKMPAVSASLVSTLVEQCPRAAWFQSWLNPKPADDDSDAAQGAGTIAHAILLEGSEACVEVIDPARYPAKNGNIPEGWKNPAIREARDTALRAGKVPVLPAQIGEIREMVTAAREFIESLRETEPAIWKAFQPDGGASEVTLTWEDREGVLCRARPDRISADHRLIVDYKTGGTTAEPDTWGRTQLVRMGYYVSAAFYRRGVRKITGEECAYVFLVQEQQRPYLCSLVGVDPAGYDLGDRKVAKGLEDWARCVRSGQWPAYPPRVCYADIPPWEVARFEAREGIETAAHGIPYDVANAGWDKARAFALESDPAA